MFKRMLPWIVMVLIVITLLVIAAFLLWDKLFSDPAADPSSDAKQRVEDVAAKKMSPTEIKDLSVEMNDILSNLATDEIIQINFTFELSNSKVKEEFTLLDFKIRSIINQVLRDMTPEQLQGSKGMDLINSSLLNRINQMLTKGKVREVNITKMLIT